MAETDEEFNGSSAARERAEALALEFRTKHDDPDWLDSLNTRASGELADVPWTNLDPNPLLIDWLAVNMQPPTNIRALVVGSGLGDDAEELADWGFEVTAFDISNTAIDWCRDRYVGSAVTYKVADLLDPPVQFFDAFDFVLEIYTLQSLDATSRTVAIGNLPKFLRRNGLLLLICGVTNDSPQSDISPFTLMRQEQNHPQFADLKELTWEELPDPEDPRQRRFRALYSRL